MAAFCFRPTCPLKNPPLTAWYPLMDPFSNGPEGKGNVREARFLSNCSRLGENAEILSHVGGYGATAPAGVSNKDCQLPSLREGRGAGAGAPPAACSLPAPARLQEMRVHCHLAGAEEKGPRASPGLSAAAGAGASYSQRDFGHEIIIIIIKKPKPFLVTRRGQRAWEDRPRSGSHPEHDESRGCPTSFSRRWNRTTQEAKSALKLTGVWDLTSLSPSPEHGTVCSARARMPAESTSAEWGEKRLSHRRGSAQHMHKAC